jgi:hypothetical protein
MDSVQDVEETSASSSKSELVFCEECDCFDESKIVFPPIWRCFHSSNKLPHPIKRDAAKLILSANKKNENNDCLYFTKKEPKPEPKKSWICRLLSSVPECH